MWSFYNTDTNILMVCAHLLFTVKLNLKLYFVKLYFAISYFSDFCFTANSPKSKYPQNISILQCMDLLCSVYVAFTVNNIIFENKLEHYNPLDSKYKENLLSYQGRHCLLF